MHARRRAWKRKLTIRPTPGYTPAPESGAPARGVTPGVSQEVGF